MNDESRYFSFLLRMWLAGDNSQPQWRASLENPRTGERLGFASLEDLFRYLKQRTRLDTEEKVGLARPATKIDSRKGSNKEANKESK